MLNDITICVLTFNESANIARTLAQLSGFPNVLVVDSFSTDDTVEIARGFPNTKIFQRRFDSFCRQLNFAIDQAKPLSLWVMTLDADYVLSDDLLAELGSLKLHDETAFDAKFIFCIDGKPLRASLYPPRTVLFKNRDAYYIDVGHTQQLQIQGEIRHLNGIIYHDDRKDWTRFEQNQLKYSRAEAYHLLEKPFAKLRIQDKVRWLGFVAPWLVPMVTLWRVRPTSAGEFKYLRMRILAEWMIAKEIWKIRFRLSRPESGRGSGPNKGSEKI
jgi:glycosyltransferase involved in cell wall biosynthesis